MTENVEMSDKQPQSSSNIKGDGDVTVGGNVVGRDNISHNVNQSIIPDRSITMILGILGLVAIVEILVFALTLLNGSGRGDPVNTATVTPALIPILGPISGALTTTQDTVGIYDTNLSSLRNFQMKQTRRTAIFRSMLLKATLTPSNFVLLTKPGSYLRMENG
jgi:hypothetical protein